MHVTGLFLARRFAFAHASRLGVTDCHSTDFFALDPVTAASEFVRWWQGQDWEAAAIIWPPRPPERYAGLFQFITEQKNIYSIPPSAIKGQCGGPTCTAADVICTASQRWPKAEPDTYEKAVAALAAGLCATSHFG